MSNKKESPSFNLEKTGLKKVGKGALIAGGGAILAYVAQSAGQLDFGQYTPIAVALLSVIVNAGRKFLGKYKKE